MYALHLTALTIGSEKLVPWAGYMVEDEEQRIVGLLVARDVGSVVK